MTSQSQSYLFAATTVLFWSTAATAFKICLQYLDIFQMLFVSCVTSAVMLIVILGVQKKLQQLFTTFKEHWRVTLLASSLNPVLYYLILFEAYDRLPAQVAQPINYTWAIMLTFMSIIFLKQKIHQSDIAAAFICYLGVFIIATQGNLQNFQQIDLIGVALALISTIVWAAYWVINVGDAREPVVGMALNFLCALPVVAMLCFLFSGFSFSLPGIAAGVYIGLFEMSLAFLCWSLALRLATNTSRVSNLIFLAPFLSLVFINQILDEDIYLTTYLGLAIIICGLYYQHYAVSKSADEQKSDEAA